MSETKAKLDIFGEKRSHSRIFAHDLSTPLATAKMHTDLLCEYRDHVFSGLSNADDIPAHIKKALIQSPQQICENLEKIQNLLDAYKAHLSSEQSTQNTEDAPGQNASMASERTTPLKNAKLRILLVDDEQIHHDIGEAVLSPQHTVEHANCGNTAISLCEDTQYDIVLMDMQMPIISGPQTAERLRKIVPESTIIIGLSNMPIEAKDDLKRFGFNGFLNKPLKLSVFEHLLEIIE